MTCLGLAAAPAMLAAFTRWVTFSRAARAGRFDDPIGAIFALWLDRGEANQQPEVGRRAPCFQFSE